MNILFLDQSGKLGGAELSLLDVATSYRDHSCVALLESGPFEQALEERGVAVEVLASQALAVRKESGLLQSFRGLQRLFPLIWRVAQFSRHYDLIYANTPKALVVGALASMISRRPLVYHLRDIISPDHFSQSNRWLLTTLANQRASLVITNSEATKAAFVAAGGKASLSKVVYNGFSPMTYAPDAGGAQRLRQQLGLEQQFVVGQFSRLAPWKGQHILIDAIAQCPEPVTALLVGDALFGEQDYVAALHQQVESLGLKKRVKFLGFRRDIPQLMAACDVVAHTSTAPEPFGRVIVEGMLCERPVIASEAGGALELVEHGKTGWLCPPGDGAKLASLVTHAFHNPEEGRAIARIAQQQAQQRFALETTNAQIAELLRTVVASG
jgi:glycosyltransferase involved in cell wall biosynthesis